MDLFQRFSSGNLQVSLLSTAGGLPSTVLETVTVPISSIPSGTSWVSVSGFSTSVTPNEELAIRLRTDAAGVSALDWVFDRSSISTYTRGQGYGGGHPTWTDAGVDFGFRTYVDVRAVPEPASIILLGTAGLTLLGYSRRRRPQLA